MKNIQTARWNKDWKKNMKDNQKNRKQNTNFKLNNHLERGRCPLTQNINIKLWKTHFTWIEYDRAAEKFHSCSKFTLRGIFLLLLAFIIHIIKNMTQYCLTTLLILLCITFFRIYRVSNKLYRKKVVHKNGER